MDAQNPSETKQPSPPKAKTPVQTFEFITLTDNQKIDGRDRYTVRKQAMKNNTNRRIKGAKYPSSEREVVDGAEPLTGPPVIQQALQSKRFRLLPRGLQDLEDKPKPKPSCPKASSSRLSGMMMQTFELSPVHFPEDTFTLDPSLQLPTQANWTVPFMEGVGVFESQSESRHSSVSSTDSLDELLHSFQALQYQTAQENSIAPSLDPMSCLAENLSQRARLLIHHNCTHLSYAA